MPGLGTVPTTWRRKAGVTLPGPRVLNPGWRKGSPSEEKWVCCQESGCRSKVLVGRENHLSPYQNESKVTPRNSVTGVSSSCSHRYGGHLPQKNVYLPPGKAGVLRSQCLGGLRHWGGTQSAWRMERLALSNLGSLPEVLLCLLSAVSYIPFQSGTGQGQVSDLHCSDRECKHTLMGFTRRKLLKILSTEETVFQSLSPFSQTAGVQKRCTPLILV